MRFWLQLAGKIDALSLRERALVFLAATAGIVALVYATVLQPLVRQQRGHLERIKLAQTQLKSISEELEKSAPQRVLDPAAPKRERIEALEIKLGASERLLAQKRTTEQLSPEQVTHLLQDVLGGNRNLRLLGLRILPGVSAEAPSAAKPPATAPPKSPAQPSYRHEVEVQMTGTYLDLLKYLQDVEALPWKLAWTQIELKTANHPRVHLRATLSTTRPNATLLTF